MNRRSSTRRGSGQFCCRLGLPQLVSGFQVGPFAAGESGLLWDRGALRGAASAIPDMEATVILPPDQRTPRSTPPTPTDFARQVLDGLPLAHASLALFAYGVPTSVLADLFHRHRGRGYEDVVTDDVHTVTGRWPHTLIEVAPHLADAMSR